MLSFPHQYKQMSDNYSKSGVNYNVLDLVKRMAQDAASDTSSEIMNQLPESRGESAFVSEIEGGYMAFVIEGLGTKNLVADKMYELSGKSYYGKIAQDTVGAIVNDILVVGAKPAVVNAYWAVGDSGFWKDKKRSEDLVKGWANACKLAGAIWGGGETPGLSGIINPETIDLAGSCVGIIKPKERLTLGDKLKVGDAILLIESNGIHANGLSLARKISGDLKEGYLTEIEGGKSYGEALLKPGHIYAKLVDELFKEGVNVHYMVNITGHGFRKLMRAKQNFKYVLNQVPEVPRLFKFMQEKAGISDEEMYSIFNMGAGYAVYIPQEDVKKAQEIAKKYGYKSWNAGRVEEGEKQVVIEPINVTFKAESLGVR